MRSVTETRAVDLPDNEQNRAVEQLRKDGVVGRTIELSDGRKATYRGGPFKSVEIG